MANIKTGIDYFPLDIDFFQDEKIQFVSARFGTKGEAITVRLLCKIYRNGYYVNWDEDTALLFAKGVGDGCSDSCVNDVVHELVKRGFFDKGIFDRFGVLTSRGIQRRFLEATGRRKKVEMDGGFLLVSVAEYQNVNIPAVNVYIMDANADILKQSKVKESRVEESKVDGAKAPARANKPPKKFVPPTLDEVKAYCKERDSSVDPKKFFDYFDTGKWVDSNGKPVRNWKQKLITWEGRQGERASPNKPPDKPDIPDQYRFGRK